LKAVLLVREPGRRHKSEERGLKIESVGASIFSEEKVRLRRKRRKSKQGIEKKKA